MLIIVDNRIPLKAKERLNHYGNVIHFETEGITYEAISGHPDIFFCKMGEKLIVAPNLPNQYKEILINNSVHFIEGELPVGHKYPETAYYNAVVTENFLIHNLQISDKEIKNLSANLETIHIGQGYSRCNLLPLKNNSFITSDKGIRKVLIEKKMIVHYASPSGIVLPGYEHGFFGGTCGVFKDKVFFIGSLRHFANGEKVRQFLKAMDYEIVELYDGSLIDGGSLIAIDN